MVLSCPVCRQVYELPTGETKGIQLKEGLGGWVNGLARSGTLSDAEKPITSYPIRARRPTEDDQQDGQGKGGIIVEVEFTSLKDTRAASSRSTACLLREEATEQTHH